ncbi:hypothetical protein MKX07_005032 [Trichoderma sp. CBMAI-0711]|nr:hypothetical protein MKX07_005032 [Trichoderma sp. CBMAI-0711]
MESLYNTGEERHIEFDLGGIPHDEIAEDYLQQLSRHLKFESILKYVALPRLTIEASPRTRRVKQRNDVVPAHRGRSDLETVFRWLRQNGVRKILKVIVIDDRDPCHANSSIEVALKGFEIEFWDWKKIDIGLEAIYNSTNCVKEVSLYCSGNGAVLAGWASPQGLPSKLNFPKGYEAHDRIRQYITEFKENMTKNAETADASATKNMDVEGLRDIHTPRVKNVAVECILDDGEISYASEFQSNMSCLQPNNPWIDCVKNLSRFLETSQGSLKIPRVKVAIIDDGVDVSMTGLDEKIAIGKSFSPYANSKDLMSPYFVSTSNHGTCMAYLICELCPMVELYVAKLDQRQSSGRNDRRISIKSATEAIEWATKSKVDIISMSWTIEKPISENKDMDPLEKAVKKANENNILMFCATSDQGSQTSDYCYPGDFDGCIRIGSATETGDPMAWVNINRVDYLFPGVNIPFPDNRGKTFTQESGSSVATAAATGLASLLIYAGRLAREDDYDHLKVSRNMKQAFTNLYNTILLCDYNLRASDIP